MSTFQAIIFSIIHGFAEFLPISSSAHDILVPYLLGWPTPEGAFSGALALGAFLSLFIYFRHDWAAIISTFLGVLIYRKKPMTLDERMPLFLAVTTAPIAIAWYYLHERIEELSWSPLVVAISLAVFGLPMVVGETMSRKNKNMFDWNGLDTLVVGLGQLLWIVPGCGRPAGQLPAAFFRNYSREAAVKYGLFAATPVLLASAIHLLRPVDFHAAQPMPDLSWLSFSVAVVVTMLSGLLAIGGLMRHVQRKGFGQYAVYRVLMALAVGVTLWLRR